MNHAQRNAAKAHRERVKARGLARIEVQAQAHDTALIRAVADVLRNEGDEANRLRTAIANLLPNAALGKAFDVFGSDLPDSVFDDVFDRPRKDSWREVEF